MPTNFDALVLGPNQMVHGYSAVVTPIKSAPGVAPFPVRGIPALKPADYTDENGVVTRMDDYTFSVRASELKQQVARGDQVSNIAFPFFAGFFFTIEDTGDDGEGAQAWILKARKLNGGP